MPITWRNVDAPRDALAVPFLRDAQSSVNDSFKQFQDIISKREQFDQKLVDTSRNEAGVGYRTALQNVSTPEQLAQQEGELKAQFAALHPSQQAANLGAFEARLNGLRRGVTEGQQYTQAQAVEQARPLVGKIEAEYAAGNTMNAEFMTEQLPADMRAALLSKFQVAARSKVEQAQKDATFQSGIDTAASTRELNQRQMNVLETRTKADAVRAEAEAVDAATRKSTASFNAGEKLQQQLQENQIAQGKVGQRLGTEAGTKFVMDAMKATGATGGELNRLNERVGMIAALPEFRNARPADVVKALAGNGGFWTLDSSALQRLRDIQKNSGAAQDEADAAELGALKEKGEFLKSQLKGYYGTGESSQSTGATQTSETRTDVQRSGAVVPPRTPDEVRQVVAAAGGANPLLDKMSQLERDEINAGVRKDFSPEIANYNKTQQVTEQQQAASDKESIKAAARSTGYAGQKLNAAALDLFTLPARGVIGAANTALRIPNALGAKVGYIPTDESMTPYSDMLDRNQSKQANTPANLAARRKELEEALKKAR